MTDEVRDGGMNLLGKVDVWDNLIRIKSESVAQELMGMILKEFCDNDLTSSGGLCVEKVFLKSKNYSKRKEQNPKIESMLDSIFRIFSLASFLPSFNECSNSNCRITHLLELPFKKHPSLCSVN